MSNTLDISIFNNPQIQFISLGTIPSAIIHFLNKHGPPNFKNINPNTEIISWKDRIKHIEQHKNDFMSDNEFNNCVEQIPSIISAPDYISIHPKDNSVSFIKDYSSHISVAVKISSSGALSFRTMYPLMDSQLSNYIDKGRAWNIKDIVDNSPK